MSRAFAPGATSPAPQCARDQYQALLQVPLSSVWAFNEGTYQRWSEELARYQSRQHDRYDHYDSCNNINDCGRGPMAAEQPADCQALPQHQQHQQQHQQNHRQHCHQHQQQCPGVAAQGADGSHDAHVADMPPIKMEDSKDDEGMRERPAGRCGSAVANVAGGVGTLYARPGIKQESASLEPSRQQPPDHAAFSPPAASVQACRLCRHSNPDGTGLWELNCGHEFHPDCLRENCIRQKNLLSGSASLEFACPRCGRGLESTWCRALICTSRPDTM